MSLFKPTIGIDLGTSFTRVYVPGKGIVFNEHSLVAIDNESNSIVALGDEAALLVGKSPQGISLHRPLKEGVVADYRVAEALLAYAIDTTLGKWQFFKPDIVLSAPSKITSMNRRALSECALGAGAKHVHVLKVPLLTALGVEIPVNEPGGYLLINIGGGVADIAVLSLGGIISSKTISLGGNVLDKAISDFVKRSYNIVIGEQTATMLKHSLGAVSGDASKESLDITGTDLVSGMPRSVALTTKDISRALAPHIATLIQSIKDVLHTIPPELASDIMDKGVTLAGGGALLKGLQEKIYNETDVPVTLAKDPSNAVVKGACHALMHLPVYKKWTVRS